MKKRISMLLALVFVFSVLFIPVQAADTAGVAVSGTISLDDLDSNPDVIVSDPMTFTEMIARMAKNADMSYDEVLRMLPDTMQTQAASLSFLHCQIVCDGRIPAVLGLLLRHK